MPEIKCIVYPTCFTSESDTAQEYARFLADQSQADLHVIHVFDTSSLEIPAPYFMLPSAEHWVQHRMTEVLSRVQTELNALGTQFGSAIAVTTNLIQGKPGPGIVEYVDQVNADMVVMGTHGYTGLDRLVLGSVAEYVVRHANCAVLTVKSKQNHSAQSSSE